MRDRPIELSVTGVTRIMHGGRRRIGPYEIFVRHDFLSGVPGIEECGSVERQPYARYGNVHLF
jgi:hypothetical protein